MVSFFLLAIQYSIVYLHHNLRLQCLLISKTLASFFHLNSYLEVKIQETNYFLFCNPSYIYQLYETNWALTFTFIEQYFGFKHKIVLIAYSAYC